MATAGEQFVRALGLALATERSEQPPDDAGELYAFVQNGLKQLATGWQTETIRTIERWFRGEALWPSNKFKVIQSKLSGVRADLRADLENRYAEARAALRANRPVGPAPPVGREITAFRTEELLGLVATISQDNFLRRQVIDPLALPVGVVRHGSTRHKSWYSPDGLQLLLDLLRRHRKAGTVRFLIRGPRGGGKAHLTRAFGHTLFEMIRQPSPGGRCESPFPVPLLVSWPKFAKEAQEVLHEGLTAPATHTALASRLFKCAGISPTPEPLAVLRSSAVVAIVEGVRERLPQNVSYVVVKFLAEIRRLVLAETSEPDTARGGDAAEKSLADQLAGLLDKPNESEAQRYAYSLAPLPFDSAESADACRRRLARYFPAVGQLPRLGDALNGMALPGVVARVRAGAVRGAILPKDLEDDTLLFAALYMDDLRRRKDNLFISNREENNYGADNRASAVVADIIEQERKSASVPGSRLADDTGRWLFAEELRPAWLFLREWYSDTSPTELWTTGAEGEVVPSRDGFSHYHTLLGALGVPALCKLAKERELTDPHNRLWFGIIDEMNARISAAAKMDTPNLKWENVCRYWKPYTHALLLRKDLIQKVKSERTSEELKAMEMEVVACLESVFNTLRLKGDEQSGSFRAHAAQTAAQIVETDTMVDDINLTLKTLHENEPAAADLDRLLFWGEVARYHKPTNAEQRDNLANVLVSAIKGTYPVAQSDAGDNKAASVVSAAHTRYHLVEALSIVCNRAKRARQFQKLQAEMRHLRTAGPDAPFAVEEAICTGTLVQDGVMPQLETTLAGDAYRIIRDADAQLRCSTLWNPLLFNGEKPTVPWGVWSHFFAVLRYLTPLLPAYRRQQIVDMQQLKHLDQDDIELMGKDTVRVRWLLDWLLPEIRAGIVPSNKDLLDLLAAIGEKLEENARIEKEKRGPNQWEWQSESDLVNLRDFRRLLAVCMIRPNHSPAPR